MGWNEVPPAAVAAREWCCKSLTELIRRADVEGLKNRRIAGLQVAHVFDEKTGQYKWSPLVYVIPGKGQGKSRKKPEHILIVYCPFCGRKLAGES